MMQIKDLRKYLDSAVKFKTQVDAFQFQLNLIEVQLRDILYSDDLDNLPEDVQESMIIPRVRALRYWKIQLDDYKDKHLIALVNVLKNVRSTELDVTLEEAKRYFVTSDDIPLEPVEYDEVEVVKPEKVHSEKVLKEVVKEEEVIPLITGKPKSHSDDDILAGLIAGQKG